jgi:hypothetical protein
MISSVWKLLKGINNTGLRIDIHAGNYAEAKNIFKVPNFRNISICRNLEIKT